MSSKEAFEKWKIDSAEKLGKSNLTIDEGRIAWFAWRAAQADQAAAISQLQADNAKLRDLLKHSKCPSCNGSGVVLYSNHELEQCQFCYEKTEALGETK